MNMDATRFQRFLLGAIAAIILLIGVGYYFLAGFLQSQAIATNHARIDAEVSANDADKLQALQQQLLANKDVVARAEEIIGSPQNYQYQDDFIRDINALAAQTGVGITGFLFPSPSAAGGTSSSGVSLPAGVKKVAVTINTATPLPYQNYLRFLRALELNLTRLQVTGVTLAPDASDPHNVTNSTIGIEIYVRG